MLRPMDLTTIEHLKSIAAERLPKDDPSHDISHALRVLRNAQLIASQQIGDMEILIPAALFHDLVNPPKCSPEARRGPELSALEAAKILICINDYPDQAIREVERCIRECSFTNGLKPSSVESAILQDADLLESLGAVAIMRTFASSGKINRAFYDAEDPFGRKRDLNPRQFAVDLFKSRLLRVSERLNTDTAKKIAQERETFLHVFLTQFGEEIGVPYP